MDTLLSRCIKHSIHYRSANIANVQPTYLLHPNYKSLVVIRQL